MSASSEAIRELYFQWQLARQEAARLEQERRAIEAKEAAADEAMEARAVALHDALDGGLLVVDGMAVSTTREYPNEGDVTVWERPVIQ